MNWTSAHRLAMLAAAKAHKRYRVDVHQRVDVFAIIDSLGIVLAFQPMSKLSGALIMEPGAPVGIIINSNHPLSRQRFTAAHELGHYWLRHGPSIDGDRLERGAARLTDNERLAEAFAEWFLMPVELVDKSLRDLRFDHIKSEIEAYQLSLRLGTSYDATVRHLQSLRRISSLSARGWLRTQPGRLKREIVNAYGVVPTAADVWIVEDGGLINARPGDRVVVRLEEIPSSGYMWRPDRTPTGTAVLGDDYSSVDPRTSKADVTGAVADHVFIFGLPEKGTNDVNTISLVKGPAWEPLVVSDRFRIPLALEPPRLGIAESLFAT